MGIQPRGIRPLEHVTNEGDGEPIWVLAARNFVSTLLLFPLLVSWHVSSTSTVGIDSSRCVIGLGRRMTWVVSSSRHLNRGTMRRQAVVVGDDTYSSESGGWWLVIACGDLLSRHKFRTLSDNMHSDVVHKFAE